MRRIALALALSLAGTPLVGCNRQQVLTQHNDVMRTGANLAETTLTPSEVQTRGMQLAYWRPVDGHMYAQPLYASGIWMKWRRRNVIYAATANNWIYAYDAGVRASSGTAAGLLWKTHLPVTPNAALPNSFIPIGTPVIDRARKTMYAVYAITNGMLPPNGWGEGLWKAEFHLVALNIRSGAVLRDIVIAGDVPSPVAPYVVRFDARQNSQRAGLLLTTDANNSSVKYVWVAFGLRWHEESMNSHGWVMRYDAATFAPRGVFCTTPDRRDINEGGGIWQGGGGLAADGSGNAYFTTGNGPGGLRSYGNSIVKLSPFKTATGGYDFRVDAFSAALDDPAHATEWANNDLDLGSGGLTVIPNSSRVVGGGKTGILYSMDFASGLSKVQEFIAFTNTYDPANRYLGWIGGPHLHGAPTYWAVSPDSGFLYHWGEQDSLRRFTYNRNTGLLDPIPSGVGKVRALQSMMPGGMISLSANGTKDGILWATLPGPGVQGRVFAIDARSLATLWETTVPSVGHFVPPTVVDGRVIVPTGSDRFYVYELATNRSFPVPPHPEPIPGYKIPRGDPGPRVSAAMAALGASASRLAVPTGVTPLFTAYGTGVLTYTARPIAGGTGLHWVETGADEHLIDDTGLQPNMGFEGRGDTLAARHGGNDWAAADSSGIATVVTAAVDAPDKGAAPWVLMTARAAPRSGLLSAVSYVQRIATKGGWPEVAASRATEGMVVRTPYSATYVFYGAPPSK